MLVVVVAVTMMVTANRVGRSVGVRRRDGVGVRPSNGRDECERRRGNPLRRPQGSASSAPTAGPLVLAQRNCRCRNGGSCRRDDHRRRSESSEAHGLARDRVDRRLRRRRNSDRRRGAADSADVERTECQVVRSRGQPGGIERRRAGGRVGQRAVEVSPSRERSGCPRQLERRRGVAMQRRTARCCRRWQPDTGRR